MANPTTNYGFVLPTATDLVTDLPADFDVALQGVDTRLKALQPGTTLGDLAYSSATANTNTRLGVGTNGQVLAVSGGVPAWTTTSDVTPLTTKGDLFTFTTVDARIGVGANNTVLTADSAEATGLKWAAPATSGKTWTLLSTTAISGSASINVTGISGKDDVLVLVVAGDTATANDPVWFRINGDTGSNYNVNNQSFTFNTTYSASDYNSYGGADSKITFGTFSNSNSSTMHSSVIISGCASTGVKAVSYSAGALSSGGEGQISNMGQGVYNASAAVTNITVLSRFGNNFNGGNVLVYVA